MSLPGTANEDVRQQAKLRARKAEQCRLEAAKALKAHDLSRDAERAKTLRLRELRLLKEAEGATARKASEATKSAKQPMVKKGATHKA
jgi:hypothetical protein